MRSLPARAGGPCTHLRTTANVRGAGAGGSGHARAARVGHNGSMTVPGLAPRGGLGGIVAVWVSAAVIAIAIGVIAPPDWRAAWMPVDLAFCVVLAFIIQLVYGHAEGFIRRVAASVLGALVVMGLIGLGLGLASLFSA